MDFLAVKDLIGKLSISCVEFQMFQEHNYILYKINNVWCYHSNDAAHLILAKTSLQQSLFITLLC